MDELTELAIGQLEADVQDLLAVLHRIANVHGCISCIYDAFDNCKSIAKRAIEKYDREEEEQPLTITVPVEMLNDIRYISNKKDPPPWLQEHSQPESESVKQQKGQ